MLGPAFMLREPPPKKKNEQQLQNSYVVFARSWGVYLPEVTRTSYEDYRKLAEGHYFRNDAAWQKNVDLTAVL